MTELDAAWDEVHAATPTGWQVGRPYLHDGRREWEQYAWLPSGRRQRAISRELGEGRWPK